MPGRVQRSRSPARLSPQLLELLQRAKKKLLEVDAESCFQWLTTELADECVLLEEDFRFAAKTEAGELSRETARGPPPPELVG